MTTRAALIVLSIPLSLLPCAFPAHAGTLVGRVVTSGFGRPVAYANVVVLGTRRGAQTGEDGSFTITEVPEGTHTLRVQLIGHRPVSRQVEVGPGRNRIGDIAIVSPEPPPRVDIGSRARVRPEDLVATIRPAGPTLVGTSPKFEVRIRNRGRASTTLVRSVDASDAWASPRVTIEITGPEGGFATAPVARCGNHNGVGMDDIVVVGPGEEFDPFAGGWWPTNIQSSKFAAPGRYTATFRYATTDRNAGPWMSGPCIGCDLSPRIRNRLAEVPAVELVATVDFVVPF